MKELNGHDLQAFANKCPEGLNPAPNNNPIKLDAKRVRSAMSKANVNGASDPEAYAAKLLSSQMKQNVTKEYLVAWIDRNDQAKAREEDNSASMLKEIESMVRVPPNRLSPINNEIYLLIKTASLLMSENDPEKAEALFQGMDKCISRIEPMIKSLKKFSRRK